MLQSGVAPTLQLPFCIYATDRKSVLVPGSCSEVQQMWDCGVSAQY